MSRSEPISGRRKRSTSSNPGQVFATHSTRCPALRRRSITIGANSRPPADPRVKQRDVARRRLLRAAVRVRTPPRLDVLLSDMVVGVQDILHGCPVLEILEDEFDGDTRSLHHRFATENARFRVNMLAPVHRLAPANASYRSIRIRVGSSIAFLSATRNVTASRPSISRWS